jgi:hypothetical protein
MIKRPIPKEVKLPITNSGERRLPPTDGFKRRIMPVYVGPGELFKMTLKKNAGRPKSLVNN